LCESNEQTALITPNNPDNRDILSYDNPCLDELFPLDDLSEEAEALSGSGDVSGSMDRVSVREEHSWWEKDLEADFQSKQVYIP